MQKEEKFLSSFKTYENLLRENGTDTKEVENQLETTNPVCSARLRMCRQFRNYLAHVPDPGFIEPTDKMQKFLDAEILALQMSGDVCKKHLRTPASSIFEPSSKCVDVLEKLVRTKQTMAVCRDGTNYTMYSIFDIVAATLESKAKKMKDVRVLKEKAIFVPPNELMENIDHDRVCICTSDGTPKGKPLGVVNFLK